MEVDKVTTTIQKRGTWDKNGLLSHDVRGKFVVGNSGGAGRPRGALGKYTKIRQDILDVWMEEGGKELFRKYLRRPCNFEKAMAIILSICPKKWLEIRRHADGDVTLSASADKDADD